MYIILNTEQTQLIRCRDKIVPSYIYLTNISSYNTHFRFLHKNVNQSFSVYNNTENR